MSDKPEIAVWATVLSAPSINAALEHLPHDVRKDLAPRLVIIGGDWCGAYHIPESVRTKFEIVCLSDAFLKQHPNADPFFISTVLHEVAHAYRKHKSKLFDGLSQAEADRQQAEADELAQSWYPDYTEDMEGNRTR